MLLRDYHNKNENDGWIYAPELILGIEEFLKWSSVPQEIFGVKHNIYDSNLDKVFSFPKTRLSATNLDKMVVHLTNNINKYLGRNEGNGNNLVRITCTFISCNT